MLVPDYAKYHAYCSNNSYRWFRSPKGGRSHRRSLQRGFGQKGTCVRQRVLRAPSDMTIRTTTVRSWRSEANVEEGTERSFATSRLLSVKAVVSCRNDLYWSLTAKSSKSLYCSDISTSVMPKRLNSANASSTSGYQGH
jgi:hypothetical protein